MSKQNNIIIIVKNIEESIPPYITSLTNLNLQMNHRLIVHMVVYKKIH